MASDMESRIAPDHTDEEVVFRVAATNEGVRTAVQNASNYISEFNVSVEDVTSVELALAEVLNNVVEHAYEGTTDGEAELRIWIQEPHIYFRILDTGRPMPNGRLPLGNPADVDREDFEQVEGGYGLYMIRQLARKLRYTRFGPYNQLSFRITLGAHLHLDEEEVPIGEQPAP